MQSNNEQIVSVQQPRSYEDRTFLHQNKHQISKAHLSDQNPFSYKIDNPTIITQNLSNILFSEEFSDVVLICKGEEVPNEKDKVRKKN